MKTHMITLIATLGLMTLLSAAGFAQAPPMNMSWGVQSQMQLQARNDYVARMTAMAYYNYMLQLRRMGYTGPSLPTGVTPESLQASIQRAQQAANGLIQSGYNNSNRTSNAINNWDMRAVRGCTLVVDAYGYQRWVCP